MSFLRKAAAVAKSQLDDVRATRDATAVRPVEPPPLGEHERGVLARALAAGAPDPGVLLTQAEAAEVAGAPLGPASLTYSDDAIGVRYAAEGRKRERWTVELTVVHTGGGPLYWRDMVLEGHGDGGDPVPGLGDAALWSAPHLFVLVGELVFWTHASTPEGDRRDVAEAAARRVLSRFA